VEVDYSEVLNEEPNQLDQLNELRTVSHRAGLKITEQPSPEQSRHNRAVHTGHEDKHQKFIRIATLRLRELETKVNEFCKVANREGYDWTAAEEAKVLTAFRRFYNSVKNSFEIGGQSGSFSFYDESGDLMGDEDC
jgi:hypothetical protein